MKTRNDRSRLSSLLLISAALFAAIAMGSVLTGCEDCAGGGEYCVELDCCSDLSCSFDQTAGYRCG